MAGRRNKDLQENIIIDYLAQSDCEDYIPSDEDLGDPAFTLGSDHNTSESESDSPDEEPIIPDSARPRGRSLRGRGSTRGRSTTSQSIPSATGLITTEWISRNFSVIAYTMTEPCYLPNVDDDFDKITFWRQYIDDNLIETMVECTNRTSIIFNGRSLNVNRQELYVFIGITFVMGALNYPWLRMYWEAKWRVPIIADNMSRNRFTLIRNSLKFVFDVDITEENRQKDKLWKMRPLIDRIQKSCKLQVKGQQLSIDEMIIPFTGTCGLKQYCPGKPNPVGLKAFVMSNPNGLVVDFDVYQGNTTYPNLEGSGFGLGEKAVLSLADNLVPGHILYFDRYFTTVKLAKELLVRGIGCTGTIQRNRVPAAARTVLVNDKILTKRGRGSCHTVVSEAGTVAITKWNDNKPIVMLSTVQGKEPIDVCQRWCKRSKQYVSVNRPSVVRHYNTYMGGVDLADRMLSVCPNRYRTKKWTQRFFSHMVDLSVCNSWLQYKEREVKKGVPLKKIQQLRSFKMELGEGLIEMYTTSGTEGDSSTVSESEIVPKRKRGKPTSLLPSIKQRSAAAKHMPEFHDVQSRCRYCHYNKSRTKCSSCNVSLCLTKQRNCYKSFHEK